MEVETLGSPLYNPFRPGTRPDQLEIRAGIREPSKAERVKALPGVTVVKATQGDKEKLIDIFKGVTVLFIVTPTTGNRAGPVLLYFKKKKKKKNRAELAIKTAEAAKDAGVQHLLVVSVPTDGITDTIIGKQFCKIEETISKLEVPYTFLRLPMILDTYFLFKETIQKMSTIIIPSDPTKPLTAVATVDAGKAAATILADHSKHADKAYTIVSNRHTFNDAAKELSNVLGKEVTVTIFTYESTEKSLSMLEPWHVSAVVQFYKTIDDGSAPNEATSHFKDITGEDPTSLKDWLNTVAPAFK